MTESETSYSEEASSVCNEEKVRKLFQLCDTNGDGFIDSNDLQTICRELNMEDALEDIMIELGADDRGMISYDEFLQRRLALKSDIDEFKRSANEAPTYHPSSSDASLGGISGGKDLWEFDSGARDLSPIPNTLQRLVEAAGGSVTSNSSASLIQLANKLHMAAVESLKAEVSELTSQLANATEESNRLKTELKELKSSSGNAAMKDRFEEQIIELHSVIAELTKKMERQAELAVIEEETCSDAEQSLTKENEDEDTKCAKKVDSTKVACPADATPKTVDGSTPDYPRLTLAGVINKFQLAAENKEMTSEDYFKAEIEKLKADVTILQHCLNHAKTSSEQMALTLGTMESTALSYEMVYLKAMRIINLYSKLSALLESYVPAYVWRHTEDIGSMQEQIGDELKILREMTLDLKPVKFHAETLPSPFFCKEENLEVVDLETAVLIQAIMQEKSNRWKYQQNLLQVEKERDSLVQELNKLKLELSCSETKENGSTLMEGEPANPKQCPRTEKLVNQEKDKDKRKSLEKIQKLENEFLNMVEQHSAQVKTLKNRIKFLEAQLIQKTP